MGLLVKRVIDNDDDDDDVTRWFLHHEETKQCESSCSLKLPFPPLLL